MEVGYLPGMGLHDYLSHTAEIHPHLRALLEFSAPRAEEALARLMTVANEFDCDDTGRGDSYRRAQEDALVRWTGVQQLLRWAVASDDPASVTVLDVLGGDGTLARAVAEKPDDPMSKVQVLTGDISGMMIKRALAQNLPAVRQNADFLFLRNESVDAVVLAYGTHHISPESRPKALAEAVRVVRPGGRVIVHDFEETSPMARFFSQVVHPNTSAGHDYEHFSPEELTRLFDSAGLTAEIVYMYDPFVVVAASADEARRGMCRYVGDMYGVQGVLGGDGDPGSSWALLESCFDHSRYVHQLPSALEIVERPMVYEAQGNFVAEVPRVSIVGLGQKDC
ncbi:class I SAM-dependent methyltransferase [Streptomyces sp. NPDC006463]|uniref:class I SAM-dependent methyltransferase n=1 Tax=Streptomyces sp. NPDC006463 TaxID=3364746 RepID=UPI0036D088E0